MDTEWLALCAAEMDGCVTYRHNQHLSASFAEAPPMIATMLQVIN